MKPTSEAAQDRALTELRSGAEAFGRLGAAGRAALLGRLRRGTRAAARGLVAASCEAKGHARGSTGEAEEWLAGPALVLRQLRLLRSSLAALARGALPLEADAISSRTDGRAVARVLPSGVADRVMLPATRAEVWMQKGVGAGEVLDGLAPAYRSPPPGPAPVALVLGAGNVSSIAPLDVLTEVFVEGRVCLLKLSPVNHYLAPHLERAFAGLIEADLLRLVLGGAEVGQRLVHHPGVDRVHLTGSVAAHDAIVWGSDPTEAEACRRAGTPLLEKPISSELGCVTPAIVVPGTWSNEELDYQAQLVASAVANNASLNCNSIKLLVTSRAWPQREAFLERLQQALAQLPTRRAYYPGSAERHARFLAAYPEARQLGETSNGRLPWTLIRDLDPGREQLAFREEAWCPVLAETALEPAYAGEFLAAATRLCNQRVWGNLSCSVLIAPSTLRDPGVALAWPRALSELRYGTVAVNQWSALGYALGSTPWGAFPGNTTADVQSGIGSVHNALMLSRSEKTVIHGPFTTRSTPPWFATHRRAAAVARWVTRYEARGNPLHLLLAAPSAWRP